MKPLSGSAKRKARKHEQKVDTITERISLQNFKDKHKHFEKSIRLGGQSNVDVEDEIHIEDNVDVNVIVREHIFNSSPTVYASVDEKPDSVDICDRVNWSSLDNKEGTH